MSTIHLIAVGAGSSLIDGVLAGLPPDDLAAAIESNIDHAVRTFWHALRNNHED